MTSYELFKFLHVVSVVAWVGSGFGLLVLTTLLRRSGDRTGALSVGRQLEKLGKVLFTPAAVSTLVWGVAMVVTGDGFGFTDPFILIGFGAIAISIALSVAIRLPAGTQIAAFVREGGPDDERIDGVFSRLMRVNVADQALLVVTIGAMVTKVGV